MERIIHSSRSMAAFASAMWFFVLLGQTTAQHPPQRNALGWLSGDPPSSGAELFPKHAADHSRPVGDEASFAGGAVRFSPPPEWQLSELPAGREIWLLVTPGETPQSPDQFRRGIRMTYHYEPKVMEQSLETLGQRLSRRLGRLTESRAQITSNGRFVFGGRGAIVQEFTIPARETSGVATRGFHILARTDLGLFELQFVSPVSTYSSDERISEAMLAGLSLESPGVRQSEITAQAAAATPVIGAWKAIGSLLVLSPDGRTTIEFDAKKHFALDSDGHYDYRRRVKRLTGTYVARGDLVLITWDDGSRLNYRWRIDGGTLYLTDHFGTVSQLQRVFLR